jgi:hypothetical protein
MAQNQNPNQSQSSSSSSSSSSGGRVNSPAQGQPPDSTVTIPDGKGGSTDRTFGPDGRAVKDVDRGHDHGAGDPHAQSYQLERRVEPLVMASEIGGLPSLYGYLKLGNLVARMCFPYIELPNVQPKFIPRGVGAEEVQMPVLAMLPSDGRTSGQRIEPQRQEENQQQQQVRKRAVGGGHFFE